MVNFLKVWLSRFPKLLRLLKRVRKLLLPNAGVSSHYIALQPHEKSLEGKRLRNSWMNVSMVNRQRALIDQQLDQYRAGLKVDVFDVFANAIRELPDVVAGMTLLEIGCSSGFYSEVVQIAKLQVKYSGCDYSAPFITLARQKYPWVEFAVMDATALDYHDCSFDIVVSGCCLLHIPEYGKAIKEAVRVCRRYVIFHRTPVVMGQAEQWFRKQAYGVETIEIHFNEPALLETFSKSGLELIATHTLYEESQSSDRNRGAANRTYVCRKINA